MLHKLTQSACTGWSCIESDKVRPARRRRRNGSPPGFAQSREVRHSHELHADVIQAQIIRVVAEPELEQRADAVAVTVNWQVGPRGKTANSPRLNRRALPLHLEFVRVAPLALFGTVSQSESR